MLPCPPGLVRALNHKYHALKPLLEFEITAGGCTDRGGHRYKSIAALLREKGVKHRGCKYVYIEGPFEGMTTVDARAVVTAASRGESQYDRHNDENLGGSNSAADDGLLEMDWLAAADAMNLKPFELVFGAYSTNYPALVIFSFLPNSRGTMSAVCRRWKEIASAMPLGLLDLIPKLTDQPQLRICKNECEIIRVALVPGHPSIAVFAVWEFPNSSIRVYNIVTGDLLYEMRGQGRNGEGEFYDLGGVAIMADSLRVCVCDTGNCRVQLLQLVLGEGYNTANLEFVQSIVLPRPRYIALRGEVMIVTLDDGSEDESIYEIELDDSDDKGYKLLGAYGGPRRSMGAASKFKVPYAVTILKPAGHTAVIADSRITVVFNWHSEDCHFNYGVRGVHLDDAGGWDSFKIDGCNAITSDDTGLMLIVDATNQLQVVECNDYSLRGKLLSHTMPALSENREDQRTIAWSVDAGVGTLIVGGLVGDGIGIWQVRGDPQLAKCNSQPGSGSRCESPAGETGNKRPRVY
jgi:hypothetical protein